MWYSLCDSRVSFFGSNNDTLWGYQIFFVGVFIGVVSMSNYLKRFFILLFMGIVFLGALFFFKSHFFNGSPKVDNDSISLYCTDQGRVSITNKLPLTDNVGRRIELNDEHRDIQGYLECTLQSNSSAKLDYELYLLKDLGEGLIDANYIKIYLSDDFDVAMEGYDKNAVPTYASLKVADSDPAGARLYTGSLKGREKITLKLRMWVADSYVITDEIKKFGIVLKAKIK